MKKKPQSPHDAVKSYLKVAQDRLKEVFFTRPEWRHPKSAKAVDVIITRIDEVYFPFSTKDKHMVAVWKQVLKEKREEMIEGLESKGDSSPKHILIKSRSMPRQDVDEKGFPALGAGHAAPAVTISWNREMVAKLKKEIHERRAMSAVARMLKTAPATICNALRWPGSKKSNSWRTRIKEAFETWKFPERTVHTFPPVAGLPSLEEVEKSLRVDVKGNQVIISGSKLSDLAKTIDGGTRPIREDARGPFDFPQLAAYSGGSLTTDFRDGQLTITVRIDVAQAIRMEAHRLAIEMNKTPHYHTLALDQENLGS